jgi:hypothetical protein
MHSSLFRFWSPPWPEAQTRVCAGRFVFIAHHVRSLHRPADYLERARLITGAPAPRGGVEQGFGFHPGEILEFLGAHFLAYSPFLLALAWAVIGSWRRVNQQFKVLFLMWLDCRVRFYLLVD